MNIVLEISRTWEKAIHSSGNAAVILPLVTSAVLPVTKDKNTNVRRAIMSSMR